jgi:hypothetical protein
LYVLSTSGTREHGVRRGHSSASYDDGMSRKHDYG